MKNPFDPNGGEITDDEFIDLIAKAVRASDMLPAEDIPERIALIEATYESMKYIAEGKDIEVIREVHTPYRSTGSVSIIGKDISIISPVLFTKCARYASNIEIYTKVNGDIQIDFTFNNITRRVV